MEVMVGILSMGFILCAMSRDGERSSCTTRFPPGAASFGATERRPRLKPVGLDRGRGRLSAASQDLVNKMFEIAGHSVTYDDIKGRQDNWYQQWEMTLAENEEWKRWGVDHLRKSLKIPKYKAEKETIIRNKTMKMDEDLPDGTEGNEITVEWEEDHIVSYKIPKVYALKRPTWEVNPTKKIEDFKIEFYKNMPDALSRFACMPPEAIDAFFKSREKIEKAFSNMSF